MTTYDELRERLDKITLEGKLGDKLLVKMHLENYLEETKQKGNLSVWGLLRFCVGYYDVIDENILDAVRELKNEGWVTE